MTPTRSRYSKCGLKPVVRICKPNRRKLVNSSVKNYGRNERLFPSARDLIHLVYLEYELEFGDECIHSCVQRNTKLGAIAEYLTRGHWKLLEVKQIHDGDPKQHSAAFYNTASHQLAIIHRGTQFLRNPESVQADIQEIVRQVNGPFSAAAYLFTKKMVDRYGNGAESITVTGHSLGGWLSQCATFYMKYPEYLQRLKTKLRKRCHGNPICHKLELIHTEDCKAHHLHCVSFDGPGCKEVLEKLFPKYLDDRSLTFRKLDALDITVYLTSQNFVNISNQQVGSVFKMECESIFSPIRAHVQEAGILRKFWNRFSKKEWREQFLESHSSEKILEFWNTYDKQSKITGTASISHRQVARVMKVTNWNVVERLWLDMSAVLKSVSEGEIQLEKMNPLEFRMSCFKEEVRENICRLSITKGTYSGHGIWGKYFSEDCIKFMTTDFECKYDFQVLKIESDQVRDLSEQAQELYRDYFIRSMQRANKLFKDLNIDSEFPNYLEALYISRTDHYLETVPEFCNTDASPLLFVKKDFESPLLRFVNLIRTPVGGTKICTAKVYQILESLQQPNQPSPDCKYLCDPKQFLIMNSNHLSKLNDLLALDGNPFLSNLKCMVIECETEANLESVQRWMHRLCYRGQVETKIVIVHELGRVVGITKEVAAAGLQHYSVDENGIKELCANVDPNILMEKQSIQFKRKGQQICFNDLVCKSEFPQFYDELAGLGGFAIYSTFQKGTLGAFLPELDKFDESYFLERTFQEIKVTGYESSSFGSGKDIMEFFYILCDSNHMGTKFVKEFSVSVSRQNGHVVLCAEWADINLHMGTATGQNGHVLELQNFQCQAEEGKEKNEFKLFWRKTFGKPEMCRLKLRAFGRWDWHELLRNEPNRKLNQIKIIADEPGMGKTRLMQKLALHSHNDKGTWTIFMELGKEGSKLAKIGINRAEIVEALAKIEAGYDWKVAAIFLSHLLQQQDRVRIFLDGFDEIKESLQKTVLAITEFLSRETKVCVFIASRDRLLRELTDKLHVPCYKLNPLTDAQSHEFLEKFWTLNPEFEAEFKGKVMKNQSNLRNYIKEFFIKFRKAIGKEADKFVGIPFQLRMLAEGSMRKAFYIFFEEFCDSVQNLETHQLEKHIPAFSRNIIDLYRDFIQIKIESGLETKVRIPSSTEYFEESVEKMQKIHRGVGFAKIFSAKIRDEIALDPNKLKEPSAKKSRLEKLYACGIVRNYSKRLHGQSEECDESEFVHRTVAEFLAAEFIFFNLKPNFRDQNEKMKWFLKSYIFLSKYENVLFFLNKVIAGDAATPQVLRNIADSNANVVEVATEQFRLCNEDVDRLGRNLMHYIIIFYKFERQTKCEVCGNGKTNCFLLHGEYLLGNQDLFNATPLAYVFSGALRHCIGKKRARSLISVLLNHDIERDALGKKILERQIPKTVEEILHRFLNLEDKRFCSPPCEGTLYDQQALISRITEFVAKNESYLSDHSIELWRNDSWSAVRKFLDLEVFDVELALALDGESRINFVCTACRRVMTLLCTSFTSREEGMYYCSQASYALALDRREDRPTM